MPQDGYRLFFENERRIYKNEAFSTQPMIGKSYSLQQLCGQCSQEHLGLPLTESEHL